MKTTKANLHVAKAFMLGMSILSPHPSLGQEEKAGPPEQTKLIESLNGAKLYKAYCAVCHGVDATGNGPEATVLKVKVPDLTTIRQRNGGSFPESQVQKIISGERTRAAHGTRQMPIWGPIFSQVERDQDFGKVRIYNLAKYLESLQKK